MRVDGNLGSELHYEPNSYGKGVANSLGIPIETVDLNLPLGNSRENQWIANNMHPELNIPTKAVDPGRAIDTNKAPYIMPQEDPWLL